MKRILIAYFSREGANFRNGKETTLSEGNTEKLAKLIQKEVGGDFFEIIPAIPYSNDYQECLNQTKAEKASNARPALKGAVENLEDYDVVFLGYPNWWGTCPMPVLSFLEKGNYSGKTIYTFCTHEGSRSLYSVADISASAKGAKVVEGPAINGTYLAQAEPTVKEWLASIKKELE